MKDSRETELTHAGPLLAGVGKREISTDTKGVVVNDPLHAKALALDDGGTKVVIIAMDAVAIGGICDIGDDFLPRLRDRLKRELGLQPGNILVNASHTHTAPPMLCGPDEQLERTFDAVRQALGSMTEAKIGSGSGREDRIMTNRTFRLKNGGHWTMRQAYPCPPDDEIAELGPVDPEIGIIRVDRKDGRPLAVVYNFAGHPLIGAPGGAVTANYPGFASKLIEESLGEGVMALFLQGAGGDVAEALYKNVGRPRDSETAGMMLGLSALKALKNIKTGNAGLGIISGTVELPRRTDIPARVGKLRAEQESLLKSLRFTSLNHKTFIPLLVKHALSPARPSGHSYEYLNEARIGEMGLADLDSVNEEKLKKYLLNIQSMEKLTKLQDDIETLLRHKAIKDEAGGRTITAEVMGVRIGGDCAIITAPLEALAEIGLNIKKASPFRRTLMAAYTNGYMHYGPPADYYDKGGYEVTECFLAPEWQDAYEGKAGEILRRLKNLKF